MDKDKLIANWDWWIVEGALWRGGLFNDTIFVDYLDQVLPKEGIFKKVLVGATDTKTGEFKRFTESLGYQDMVYKAARASASIPGVFEPVDFQGMTLVDGGVVINLDIAGAIDRCKDVADSEEDIIVDVIMTSGKTLTPVNASSYNSLQMFWRYYKINSYHKTMHWITHAITNFPRVQFRYIVVPEKPIDNEIIPIDFSPKNIERLISQGIDEAKRTVENGPYSGFADILKQVQNPVSEIKYYGHEDSIIEESA